MTSMEEVPTLSLPREDMMRLAMALRSAGTILRQIRETRGRSAFDDAENVARREAIAAANGLRKMSAADAAEWNEAAQAGRIVGEQHPDSGMTVRVAPLSGDRFGVQAGWEDNHTTTVVGSQQMADDLRAWLRNNSHRGAVDDLRAATEEMHEYSSTAEPRSARREQLDQAEAWIKQPENAALREIWEDKAHESFRGENGFEKSRHESWLMGEWKQAQKSATAEHSGWDSLADRVRGRVPDDILNSGRWAVAEEQFSKLVDGGADPDLLADSVAGIDFNDGIRSPSGFAAWTMRDAAKHGRAQQPGQGKSEDQAKREVADEWLSQADPDNPLDRARAAQLVGQIDEKFDAQLAERYPGILDGDRARNAANSRAEHHEGNARAAEATAAGPEADADLDRDRVIVIDSEGNAVLPFEPFTADEADHAEDQAETASADASTDRTYVASEREHAQHEREKAVNAVNQPTEAARKADGPLKPPVDAQKAARTAARKAAPSHAPTATKVPKRSM